ncbi:MAG: hypothetical protein ACOYVG_11190 [Bacteroidota bacterium]
MAKLYKSTKALERKMQQIRDGLKSLDDSIKDEIWTKNPHKPITTNNYLEYAPAEMM